MNLLNLLNLKRPARLKLRNEYLSKGLITRLELTLSDCEKQLNKSSFQIPHVNLIKYTLVRRFNKDLRDLRKDEFNRVSSVDSLINGCLFSALDSLNLTNEIKHFLLTDTQYVKSINKEFNESSSIYGNNKQCMQHVEYLKHRYVPELKKLRIKLIHDYNFDINNPSILKPNEIAKTA